MPHRSMRNARYRVDRGWRQVGIALLAMAGCASTLAGESAGGLTSSFRPQAGRESPAGGARDAGTQTDAVGVRIVVSGQARPLAVIDGRIVHEGDVVNGQRVVRIRRSEVVLGGEGGSVERMKVNPAATKSQRTASERRDSNGVNNP